MKLVIGEANQIAVAGDKRTQVVEKAKKTQILRKENTPSELGCDLGSDQVEYLTTKTW
jgi:hypothetical protein